MKKKHFFKKWQAICFSDAEIQKKIEIIYKYVYIFLY